MISCSSIQKLERYGQLGLKRSTVEEFILSSLRDPKRSSVFALTELNAWKDCYASLSGKTWASVSSELEKSVDSASNAQNTDGTSPSRVISSSSVITDSFVGAMGYSVAFISYHIQLLLHSKAYLKDTKKSAPQNPTDGNLYVFEKNDIAPALALLEVLHGITTSIVTVGRRKICLSTAFSQSVAQLLSSTLNLFFLLESLSVLYAADNEIPSSLSYMHIICLDFINQCLKLLRHSFTHYPLSDVFSSRPCSALLNKLMNQHKGKNKNSSPSDPKLSAPDAKSSLDESFVHDLSVLSNLVLQFCLHPGSFSDLMRTSLFQKLSIFHALASQHKYGSSFMSRSGNDKVANDVACICREGILTMEYLLSSIACNRSTRYAIYLRSDDVKLMQNNITQSSDYNLYTYVTTPPMEEALVNSVSALVAENALAAQQCCFLIGQWLTAIPLFFESFCRDKNWTFFAQEQRRSILLKRAQERRQKRMDRKRPHDALSSVSSSSDSQKERNEIDDLNSVASAGTEGSKLSMESRASLISTMSAASAASYMSFVSVLQQNVENEGEETKLHESQDGNTNLPLILLEQLVLAIQNCMNAFSHSFLQNHGLTALAWDCIGRLFSFVQATIVSSSGESGEMFERSGIRGETMLSSSSSAAAAAVAVAYEEVNPIKNSAEMKSQKDSLYAKNDALIPIFNLQQDVRYNKGLGYECLGLLFAKVIAPKLEIEVGRSPSDDEHHSFDTLSISNSAQLTVDSLHRKWKKRIDQAVSSCLSAYEIVAPQVVDMNLNVILRIASRSMHVSRKELEFLWRNQNSNSPSSNVLSEFLAAVALRLGKSNQITILLDALVRNTFDAKEKANHRRMTGNTVSLEEEEEDVVSLQVAFSHPQVRSALVQACTLSLDPENLLSALVRYIANLSPSNDDEESAASSTPRLPEEALFLLHLFACVLEGISPTSVSSIPVLEKSTELELLLCTFFLGYCRPESEEISASKPSASIFSHPISEKQKNRLAIYTLYALYQCREVTVSCIQDLGLQKVSSYLLALNEALWQVETKVGSIVGDLCYADVADCIKERARMHYPPFVEAKALLPQLVLQRLTLARSVSVVLGIQAAPRLDAKNMVSYVLSFFLPDPQKDHETSPENSNSNKIILANSLSEEEWRSLIFLGKRKQIRSAFSSLLCATFASSEMATKESEPAQWLDRCLRSGGGGLLLRTITDYLFGLSDTEILSPSSIPFAKSLLYLLKSTGRNPFWPVVLRSCVNWILLLFKQARKQECNESCLSEMFEITLSITHYCLGGEKRCFELLRRCLIQLDQEYLVDGSKDDANEESYPPLPSSAPSPSGVIDNTNSRSLSYNICLGIPRDDFLQSKKEASSAAEEEDKYDEYDMELELRALTCLLFDVPTDTNSKDATGSEVSTALEIMAGALSYSAKPFPQEQADTKQDEAHSVVRLSMNIVSQLYSVALSVANALKRMQPRKDKAAASIKIPRCMIFCFKIVNFFLSHHIDTFSNESLSTENEKRAISIVLFSFLSSSSMDSLVPRGLSWSERSGKGRGAGGGGGAGSRGSLSNDSKRNSEGKDLCFKWIKIVQIYMEELVAVQPLDTAKRSQWDLRLRRSIAHSFTLLFERIWSDLARDGITQVFTPSKRRRDNNADGVAKASDSSECIQQNDVANSHRESVPDVVHSSPWMLLISGNEGRDQLIMKLRRLFSPNHSSANDEKVRISGVQWIQEFFSMGIDGMVAVWFLYKIYEDLVVSMNPTKAEASEDSRRTVYFETILQEFLRGFGNRDASAISALLNEKVRPSSLSHRSHSDPPRQQVSITQTKDLANCLVQKREYLSCQLSALPHVIRVLHAERSPSILFKHLRAVFNAAVPESSSPLYFSGTFYKNESSEYDPETLQVILDASQSLLRLLSVPGFKLSHFKSQFENLLAATMALNSAAYVGEWQRKGNLHQQASFHRLRLTVLRLCCLPLWKLHTDAAFLDQEWLLLTQMVALASKNSETSISNEPARRSPLLLEQNEVLMILAILARTWLPMGILWKRSAVLPPFFSTLFACILDGVSQKRYERCVLNQVSSFFYQLTRHIDDASSHSSSGIPSDHDNKPSAHPTSSNAKNVSSFELDMDRPVSTNTKVLCICALSACLFEVASPYISVFTTYSSDLDYIAVDLLRCLHRFHTPKSKAKGIKFKDFQKDQTGELTGHSRAGIQLDKSSMADLAFSCIGSEDGKALFRHASLQMEEDYEENHDLNEFEGENNLNRRFQILQFGD